MVQNKKNTHRLYWSQKLIEFLIHFEFSKRTKKSPSYAQQIWLLILSKEKSNQLNDKLLFIGIFLIEYLEQIAFCFRRLLYYYERKQNMPYKREQQQKSRHRSISHTNIVVFRYFTLTCCRNWF